MNTSNNYKVLLRVPLLTKKYCIYNTKQISRVDTKVDN